MIPLTPRTTRNCHISCSCIKKICIWKCSFQLPRKCHSTVTHRMCSPTPHLFVAQIELNLRASTQESPAAQPRNLGARRIGWRRSLTRVAHGAPDRVVAPGQEELHEPWPDEAACAGHAHALPHCLHASGLLWNSTLPLDHHTSLESREVSETPRCRWVYLSFRILCNFLFFGLLTEWPSDGNPSTASRVVLPTLRMHLILNLTSFAWNISMSLQ